MNGYVPRCGDILCTGGGDPDWLGRRIGRLTTTPGEAKTIARHQGIFRDRYKTCEAYPPKVRFFDWEKRKGDMHQQGYAWAIFSRVIGLTDDEKHKMGCLIDEMIGWRYSEGELVLCAMDGLLSRIPGLVRIMPKSWSFDRNEVLLFRRAGNAWRNGVICSKTANRPWIKMDFLPKKYIYANPDNTCDFFMKSNDVFMADRSENWPL